MLLPLLPVISTAQVGLSSISIIYMRVCVCVALPGLLSDNYDVTSPVVAPHISLEAACQAIEK